MQVRILALDTNFQGDHMQHLDVSFKDFQDNLDHYLDLAESGSTVHVKVPGKEGIVLVSASHYEKLLDSCNSALREYQREKLKQAGVLPQGE